MLAKDITRLSPQSWNPFFKTANFLLTVDRVMSIFCYCNGWCRKLCIPNKCILKQTERLMCKAAQRADHDLEPRA